MSIETSFFTYLSGVAAVSALVGTRIYRIVLPQGSTFPAITYERVSTDRFSSLSGVTNHVLPLIRAHCWADDNEEARQLSDEVRKALNGFSGTFGMHLVSLITLESENDLYEDQVEIYRVIQDYRIRTTEDLS